MWRSPAGSCAWSDTPERTDGMLTKLRAFFLKDNGRELNYTYNGVIRYMPLLVAGGFFFVTIFLFAFGPLNWNPKSPGKIFTFLLCCFAALAVGYVLAVKLTKTPQRRLGLNAERYLLLGILVALALYIPTVYVSTGKWYPDVYTGIFNTGKAYRVAKYYSNYAPKSLFYIRMLLAPLFSVVMPITLFYRSRLSRKTFALGILVIVLNVSLSIAQGVSKQVADIAMQTVLMLCILMFADNTGKGGWKYKLKMGVLILLVCGLFFAYYSNAMKNRVSADIAIGNASLSDASTQEELDELQQVLDGQAVDQSALDSAVESYSTFSVGQVKEDSVWKKIIPARLQPMAQYLTSYFCHGYYGLSLAMEEDFTSTYGLGFSDFFRHNILRFFGGAEAEQQIYQRTYMAKIERQGWMTGSVWSSFFIYPASDLSFPGTVLLVLVIGFLFGLSWKDAICMYNPFALVVFMNLCTMVFYFSANNQIFQTGEPALSFTVNFLLWIATRTYVSRKAA